MAHCETVLTVADSRSIFLPLIERAAASWTFYPVFRSGQNFSTLLGPFFAEFVAMRTICLSFFVLFAMGCASNRNQYSYAPPYAPPVYPQPNGATQPAYTLPVGAVPVSGVPDVYGQPGVASTLQPAGVMQTPPCPQPAFTPQ